MSRSVDRMDDDQFNEYLAKLAALPPEEKAKRAAALRAKGGRPVRYGRGVFVHGRPPRIDPVDDVPIIPDAGLVLPSERGKRRANA